MEYLIALLGLMGGAVVWLFVKKQSAEALNLNNDTKSKLNDLGKDIAKNEGLLSSEAEKRKEIENNISKEKSTNESLEDLKGFFNGGNNTDH